MKVRYVVLKKFSSKIKKKKNQLYTSTDSTGAGSSGDSTGGRSSGDSTGGRFIVPKLEKFNFKTDVVAYVHQYRISDMCNDI